MAVENECLLIGPQTKPRYSLEGLLAQCDATADLDVAEQEWLNANAQGGELL